MTVCIIDVSQISSKTKLTRAVVPHACKFLQKSLRALFLLRCVVRIARRGAASGSQFTPATLNKDLTECQSVQQRQLKVVGTPVRVRGVLSSAPRATDHQRTPARPLFWLMNGPHQGPFQMTLHAGHILYAEAKYTWYVATANTLAGQFTSKAVRGHVCTASSCSSGASMCRLPPESRNDLQWRKRFRRANVLTEEARHEQFLKMPSAQATRQEQSVVIRAARR